ncbi:MAG: hypothetical protein KC621_03390 [Myxococcales bacterium]|nr:hypothetical protein [Myxococcales bacterium]
MRRRHTSPRLARRRRSVVTGELMLAAMVDILINLLLFLLNLYGNSPAFLRPSEDLQYARSASQEPVEYAPNLRISRRAVEVDSEQVAVFGEGGAPPSQAELDVVRDRLAARLPGGREPGRPARLVVQADKTMPWTQISPVLVAANEAGFDDIRFVVSSGH